jgi:hypothetical protein
LRGGGGGIGGNDEGMYNQEGLIRSSFFFLPIDDQGFGAPRKT